MDKWNYTFLFFPSTDLATAAEPVFLFLTTFGGGVKNVFLVGDAVTFLHPKMSHTLLRLLNKYFLLLENGDSGLP